MQLVYSSWKVSVSTPALIITREVVEGEFPMFWLHNNYISVNLALNYTSINILLVAKGIEST